MENLLIHIGYQKTGSTWLQKVLFNADSSVFQPLSPKRSGHSPLARPFFAGNDGYLVPPCEWKKEHVLVPLEKHLLEHPLSPGKVPVLSHERLAGNAHASGFDAQTIADRLKSCFPHARILIVIREQRSYILSIYHQYLSKGGNLSLKQYLNTPYEGKRPGFSPHHINYLPLIKAYCQHFGKHQVLTLPFELLQKQPEEFISQISAFNSVSIQLEETLFKQKVNKTTSHFVSYHCRRLGVFRFSNSMNNFSIWANPISKKLAEMLINTFNKMTPNSWDRSLKKKMEQDIEDWVGDRYTTSNQELSEYIETDLASFGYK